MPTWPVAGDFPQSPLVGTWTRTAVNTVQEFKPDLGPARKRRLTTGASFECSGSFRLTQAQADALLDFWRADCDFGSLSFTWIDPEDGVTPRTWEFRSVPQFQHVTAGAYEATVSLIRTS